MKATVWWFSGTGNAWLLAVRLAQGLEAQGWESELRAIETSPRPRRSLASSRSFVEGSASAPDFPPVEPEGLDVFCFPVFAFSAPVLVDRFFARLPVALGRKAALIAAMGGGGYEGRTLARAARRLKEAGRPLVLSRVLEMPEAYVQFFPATPEEEAQARTEIAYRAVDAAVSDLLSGVQGKRVPKAGGLVLTWPASVGFGLLGRRILGLGWAASRACDGCGLCARACPAATIRLVGGRPHWGGSCEDCQPCANLCPRGAIRLSLPKAILLVLPIFLPWGRILEKSLGLAGHNGRFLLDIAGILVSTALVGVLLWLLDLVPGLRDLLALPAGPAMRKRLAPGFLAEVLRLKKAKGRES